MAISWSAKRRVTYFVVTVAVLVAAGALAYFYYKPAPSCFDGKLNGDELGVDCGGACPQVCSSEIENARVVWSRIFKVDDGKYDTATLLENPNPRHGIRLLPYSIRIVDQDNILVDVLNDTTFLNPKEQVVVFHTRLKVGERVPARAILQLADSPVWQRVEQAMPKLTMVTTSFAASPTPQLLGTITNDSLLSLTNIEVAVVLSDENANAIAVSSTLVEALKPGETKTMAFTWPKTFSQVPVSISYYPHLDISKLPLP